MFVFLKKALMYSWLHYHALQILLWCVDLMLHFTRNIWLMEVPHFLYKRKTSLHCKWPSFVTFFLEFAVWKTFISQAIMMFLWGLELHSGRQARLQQWRYCIVTYYRHYVGCKLQKKIASLRIQLTLFQTVLAVLAFIFVTLFNFCRPQVECHAKGL